MTTTQTLPAPLFDRSLKFGQVLADAFAEMERNDVRVAQILVHPSISHRFVEHARQANGGVNLDPQLELEGAVATLWGVLIKIDGTAPANGFILASDEGNHRLCVTGPVGVAATTLQTGDGQVVPVVFCKNPVRSQSVMDLLDMGAPLSPTPPKDLRMEMTPQIFMGIRKFGRDVLDASTDANELKRGLMGTIHKVPVMVSRQSHPTRIVLRDDRRVYGILETDPSANPELKVQTDKVLAGDHEAYVDRLNDKVQVAIREVWSEISDELEEERMEEAKRTVLRALYARLKADLDKTIPL